MPHIPEHNKSDARQQPENVGELTFVLYETVCNYLADADNDEIRYQRVCEVRGSLWGALTEFDRLIAFPYEATAIVRNGDATPSRLYEMLIKVQQSVGERSDVAEWRRLTEDPSYAFVIECIKCNHPFGLSSERRWVGGEIVGCPHCQEQMTLTLQLS
jgi:hypothetical protein